MMLTGQLKEERLTSSLLMSTCPITITYYSETFKVTQELHKTTN